MAERAAAGRVVLVALAVDASSRRDEVEELATAVGAGHAFLQQGDPALVDVLDALAAEGDGPVRLVAVPAGGSPAPARSWLRRVAAHWVRGHPHGPDVVVADRAVTGAEAPLASTAWEDVPGHAHHVLVCRGPRCSAQGAAATAVALDDALRAQGLGDDDVLVAQTGCLFPCNHAPVVVVHPDDAWYGRVDAARAADLVDEHLVAGRPLVEGRLPRRAGG